MKNYKKELYKLLDATQQLRVSLIQNTTKEDIQIRDKADKAWESIKSIHIEVYDYIEHLENILIQIMLSKEVDCNGHYVPMYTLDKKTERYIKQLQEKKRKDKIRNKENWRKI